jgi:2',3'-cyclic-nucleotide 2'-phosphodiesterase (5'-nucleotidase family)
LGGLSKKAFLIKGLVADPKQPALILNSGNLLFKTDTLAAGEAETAKITADTIVQATRKMGGTLAGIGTRDLAAGVSFLHRYQEPPNFSWLSLNIVDPATRKPLFTPVLLRQVGGVKVAILALTDPATLQDKSGEFRVLPWQESLQEALAKVRNEADFILLLSNYGLAENQEIARNCSAIDLILQAGHAVGNLTPIVIDKTLISQAEIRGKYLGVMDIDWNGHGRWNEGTVTPQSPKNGQQLSTYNNRFIALKLSMSADPEVEALVQQTQQRIDKAQRGVR